MKKFYKTVVIENIPIHIYEVDYIGNVEPKDDEAYFWIKGYKPDFFFKIKHFSDEYGEIEGIGENFQTPSEEEIENKEKWVEDAINDFTYWMGETIKDSNYFAEVEEHF